MAGFRKKHLFAFFFLFPISWGIAQQHNFKTYSVEQGIQAQVSCFLQDSRGYMWIGTQNGGINRFDGKTFINYSKEDGLINNSITSLCEDSKGNIWIGTINGLDCYNGKTFTHYTHKDGLSDNEIKKIVKDKKGNLWFSTGHGITKFDPSATPGTGGKKFTSLYVKDGLRDAKVYTIYIDSHNHIWISYRPDKGIMIVDKYDGQKFQSFPVLGYEPPQGPQVNCIREDKLGRIWLGTEANNGSSLYVLHNGSFYPFTSFSKTWSLKDILFDSKNRLWLSTSDGIFSAPFPTFTSVNEKGEFLSDTGIIRNTFKFQTGGYSRDVQCSIEDKNQNLWFGTGTGLLVFGGDMFLHYTPKEGLPASVFGIREDASKRLWVTTYGRNWFALAGDSSFIFVKNVFKDKTTDKKIKPTRFFFDSKGNMWIGTESHGLYVYNGDKLVRFDEKSGLKKINSKWPIVIPACEDEEGHVWFMSEGDKLLGHADINDFTKPFTFVSIPELRNDSYWVNMLFVDKQKRLWINNEKKGLALFENGKLTYKSEKDGLDNEKAARIVEDSKGRIWIATYSYSGICLFENGKFRHIGKNEGFSNETIFQMIESKNGTVWFATGGDGVFAYDGKHFKNISAKQGLSNNTIWTILEDKQKNIWCGTNKGINRITLDEKGNVKRIKSYGFSEGFIGIESNQNASYQDQRGNLWFGTPSGVTKYIPSEDPLSLHAPILNFNSVKLFYKEVDWSTFDAKLTSWAGIPESLTLPYDQNHLTFSFIGIDFRSPDKVRYKFILEGQEKKWSPEVDKNEVTYSNLSAGKYTFKVVSCNADGIWNKKPISFSFRITPPWWKTTWFYIVSGLVFLALVVGFIKWRERKLKQQTIVLENKVAQRTEELNEKSNKLEEAYKHITDSIHYAKKIQEAILPPHDIISSSLRDYFIIYMPKDVVSGDYYAFFKKDDEIIIATADCTGHGVPGAFMSMIGNEQLGKIIIEKGITHPSKVLDELHNGIKKALKQDMPGGESRDGMDIALCKFNLKQNQLDYAGANRPLWLWRNNEITETRPDKFPIGGLELDNRKPFTNHSISLSAGDRIYTFTDGFADQFGGEKGKKFMLKNLEKLILSVAPLSMPEQAEKLKSSFLKWKGTHEQLDDVLLIGIQV
ncbi:MAG: two-component regulator propeller domain-containing protein [Flavobacteriales bacterium]